MFMFELQGKIQHYAWGGKVFIPSFLGISNAEDRPFAEFWMGVHPSAPSIVATENGPQSLPVLISSAPEKFLGQHTLSRFSELPYLLKILDVREMLSIQVHPSKDEAKKGFERENKEGVPLSAPHRNYKDANHKPEMMVALSDFWLLHGFKKEDALLDTLSTVPELASLKPIFEQSGYRGLYQTVMELEQSQVDALLAPLAARIIPAYEQDQLPKSSPDFWAARAIKTYSGYYDRGIFSIYFFNLVNLKKGEAIFQGAGLPHAYLEGQNVELMSNSDNVLRGGLTPKHVDVEELMKHTLFEAIIPQKMTAVVNGPEQTFACPVPDFSMKWVELEEAQKYVCVSTTPEILLVLDGGGTIANKKVAQGEAFFLSPGESISLIGPVRLVRAFVP